MKAKTIVILICLFLAATIAFYYFKSRGSKKNINFLTVQPMRGYIAKTITATGTVQPVDTVTVGAQVSGVVKYVYADFNNTVRQGQLLAKVDPSLIAAQADQAKANLANATSNFDYQKSNYDRQSQLFDAGAISKAEYQVALNQFNSARAVVDNSRAQLKMAKRNLYYTDIYSPISGVVLNRTISAGQTIASSFNAPTLFVIARNLTKMQVNAYVDEADIGGVSQGQRVTFAVDAFPNETFYGRVKEILLHPTVSANVVTYITRIDIDNQEMKLKPGMTARINIYTEEDSNSLLIPSRALTFKPDTTLLKKFIVIKAVKNAYSHGEKSRINNRNAGNKTENEVVNVSYVWIKNNDTLMEKEILTGINDDSYVRIVRGVCKDKNIIVKMVIGTERNNADQPSSSPFMPQMRRPQPSRTGGSNSSGR